MALPVSDANTKWPPENLETIFGHMQQWSAWYSNELSRLQEAYGGGKSQDSTGFFASDGGGFKASVGRTLQRWFVGNRPSGVERNTKLPVPLAAMICQASADLLYADPPTFTVKDAKTQARLNVLADDDLYSVLAQSAEIGAALGGSFLRVAWDKTVVADRPFVDVVDADQAIPEFRWGRLVGVTFWQVVAREGENVWRHLERHELDATNGHGVILHGLYLGKDDALGVRVGLDSRNETMSLANLTADAPVAGQISSQSPGLCVEYVPNQNPNRLWRSHLVGRHYGRSDLDGVEHLLDQLAETMSDWMRARRAARARIMFDKSLTQSAGPGNGVVVDLDQETYTSVNVSISGPNVKLADKIETLQPNFETIGYSVTAQTLIEQILQLAGYSLQTFGMDQSSSKSADTTATEIEARERRTFMTRGRKIRASEPRLARLLSKLLAVDKAIFNTPNSVEPIWVEFPDGVQESQLRAAQTALAMFTGQSGSVLERVKVMHPDWNDDMWRAEAAAIVAENVVVADPMSLPAEAPDDEDPSDE